jgi:hypothetical protein
MENYFALGFTIIFGGLMEDTLVELQFGPKLV